MGGLNFGFQYIFFIFFEGVGGWGRGFREINIFGVMKKWWIFFYWGGGGGYFRGDHFYLKATSNQRRCDVVVSASCVFWGILLA